MKRPLLIKAVATVELSRATLLLAFVAAVYFGVLPAVAIGNQFRFALSVASGGVPIDTGLDKSSMIVLLFFLSLSAVVSLVMGCGVLLLKVWARRFLLFTSGMSAAAFARGVLFTTLQGHPGALIHQIYLALFMVNAMIFVCLLDEENLFS